MSYSTDNDLLAEFTTSDLARLTGDPSGVTIDYDRIEHARADADSIINGYLVGRYPLPLEEPLDPLIIKLSVDLTVVHLFEFAYSKGTMPNTVVWRRINALKVLKDLMNGSAGLMLNPVPNLNSGKVICSKERTGAYTETNLNEYP